MKIAVREAGAARIVDVTGEVDLASSPELRRVLLSSLRECQRLAVNLSAIRYIDSSGIATLIEVLKESQNAKKELALFGMGGAVLDVFKLTHVIKIFQVYDSEEQAVSGTKG